MTGETVRVDKWLWFARLFKSRTLATALCRSGRLRINGVTVEKAHQGLKTGDVLTFPKADYIRVIRVVALGSRRGPVPEAHSLYEDLDPPAPEKRLDPVPAGARSRPSGARATLCEAKGERTIDPKLRGA